MVSAHCLNRYWWLTMIFQTGDQFARGGEVAAALHELRDFFGAASGGAVGEKRPGLHVFRDGARGHIRVKNVLFAAGRMGAARSRPAR